MLRESAMASDLLLSLAAAGVFVLCVCVWFAQSSAEVERGVFVVGVWRGRANGSFSSLNWNGTPRRHITTTTAIARNAMVFHGLLRLGRPGRAASISPSIIDDLVEIEER